MAENEGWPERFAEAWAAWEQKEGKGRTTGRAFAKALGWPESTLSEVRYATEPPDHTRIAALSRVSGLHPGYLSHSTPPKFLVEPLRSAQNAPETAKPPKGSHRPAKTLKGRQTGRQGHRKRGTK